jgi:hypothetical protein
MPTPSATSSTRSGIASTSLTTIGYAASENLAVIMVETEREDWSFGRGQASYLELPRDAWR